MIHVNEAGAPADMKHGTATAVILGATVAGLALRILWLTVYPRVIENEGAEYARLAENLLAGRGYVGVFGGPHALFPPLFPILIGLVTSLTHNSEVSARLISLIAGTAAIWPLCRLGRMIGGQVAELAAAAFAATHGLFVALSASAYSESTYFCLVAWGLYLVLKALEGGATRDAALAGVAFGLAYLVRPEAMLYPPIAALILVARGLRRPANGWPDARRAMILLATFGILMAPYVTWLSVKSGYFRVEGKSASNSVIAARMNKGMTYPEAAKGLSASGEPEGPFLIADQFMIRPAGGSTQAGIIATAVAHPLTMIQEIVSAIVGTRSLGGIGMIALAVLGIAVSLRGAGRLPGTWFLLIASAAYLVPLMSMQHRFERHLFPVALFMLPWAAVGAAHAWRWLDSALGLSRALRPRRRNVLLSIYLGAAALWIALPSVSAVWHSGEFAQARTIALKTAGTWLGEQAPRDKTIMAGGGVVAYYAGATFASLPYASSSLALQHIHRAKPDFIVLRTRDERQAPYIAEWLTNGIPDACGILVKQLEEDEAAVLRVYRWSCG
jgi:4-amino-4-deoxy-L-arabinose transferase-like glycosyltransferase